MLLDSFFIDGILQVKAIFIEPLVTDVAIPEWSLALEVTVTFSFTSTPSICKKQHAVKIEKLRYPKYAL